MKLQYKMLALLLCVAMMLTMAACSKKQESPGIEQEQPEMKQPAQETQEQEPSEIPVESVEVETETSELKPADKDSAQEMPSGETTELPVPEAPAEDIQIDTPYGMVRYPGQWGEYLKVEQTEGDPYILSVSAKLEGREPCKVFCVTFGEPAADVVGAVQCEDGSYALVGVEYASFAPAEDWNDSEKTIFYGMQEALNYVLETLNLQDPALAMHEQEEAGQSETELPSAELPESMKEDLAMDTPYMELHYPSQWSETLSIIHTEAPVYSVAFFSKVEGHEDVHLFTVFFGGTEGVSLKTIQTADGSVVDVRLLVPEIDLDDTWTDDEAELVYTMQEDLNYLLDKMNG